MKTLSVDVVKTLMVDANVRRWAKYPDLKSYYCGEGVAWIENRVDDIDLATALEQIEYLDFFVYTLWQSFSFLMYKDVFCNFLHTDNVPQHWDQLVTELEGLYASLGVESGN